MLELFSKLRIRRINGGFTYLATQMDTGNWLFVRDGGTIKYTLSAEGFKEELRAGRRQVIDNPLADAINVHYAGTTIGKATVDMLKKHHSGEQTINVKFDTSELSVLSDSIVAVAKAGEENRKRIDELHERIEPSSVETVQCAQYIISPTIWQLRRARAITVRGKTEFREHPSDAFFNPMLRGPLETCVNDLLGEQVTIEYFSDAVWQPYAEEQFKAARCALHLAADAAADARDAWNRADRAYLEAHRAQEEWYDNLR